MELTIKPFTEKYTERCAELLQYLWKEPEELRVRHLRWGYLQNPNNDGVVAAVIAVNENDDVIGFRGFHLLKAYFGQQEEKIAYMSDTVVSPKARRQGIMQKMTNYSFDFLRENGIFCIGDLGPSWPPYYGDKKLTFEDLSIFFRKFRLFPSQLFNQKVMKRVRTWEVFHTTEKNGLVTYHVATDITDEVLKQIPDNRVDGVIYPGRDMVTLKWKAEHPDAHYVFAYSLDGQGKVISFIWTKTCDGWRFNLALYFSSDMINMRHTFQLFKKVTKPSVLEAWTWALTDNAKDCLKAMHFHCLPFINKIKKNPPAIVRSLKEKSDGTIDWMIDGIDIRKSGNWKIDKFEADSF